MGINKRIKRIIAWTMVLTMIPWSSFVYGKNVLAASEYPSLAITNQFVLQEDMEVSDITLDGEAELDLNGYSLYVHGGILQQSGKIIINGGELTIDGDYRMQKVSSEETDSSDDIAEYELSETSLIMTNPEDIVTVNGDYYISSSLDSQNNLSNGVFTLSGDFYISDDSNKKAFYGTNSFKMILNGEENQNLDLSGDVWIPIFEPVCAKTITSDTIINVNNELISSYEDKYDGVVSVWDYVKITGDGFGGTIESRMFSIKNDYHIAGDLLNKMLLGIYANVIVDGDVICEAGIYVYDELYIKGSLLSDYYRTFNIYFQYESKLKVEGDVRFSREGSFTIKYGNEPEIIICGDFETHCSGICEAGTINVGGDFIADGFSGKSNNKVILNGASLQTIDISEKSRFATIELQNTSSEGVISKTVFDCDKFVKNNTRFSYDNVEGELGYTLSEDVETDGDMILIDGVMDLNGHTLIVNGDLIQAKGEIKINNGRLIVKGNYRQQNKVGENYGASSAKLVMTNANDFVEVEKDFIIDTSVSNKNNQTNGTFVLGGNLEFYSDSNSLGFCPTDSFVLMLAGQTEQSLNNFKIKKEYANRIEYSNDTLKLSSLMVDDSVNNLVVSGSELSISKIIDVKDTDMQVKVNLPLGSKIIGDVYTGRLYVETELSDDIEINGMLEGGPTISGNVTVKGNADVYDLKMNSGFLDITGNLIVQYIHMTHEDDRVRVQGDFIKEYRSYSKNELTDGVLEIGGNFTSSDDPYDFICKGNHKTYMIPDYHYYNSANKRKIKFGKSDSRASRFNKLYLSGSRESYEYDNDVETIANEIIYDYDQPVSLLPVKGLTLAEATQTSISFSFNDENIDPKATVYYIYRDGKKIGSTVKTVYTDKNLKPDTQYRYSVTASDDYGRESEQSEELIVGTSVDDTAPSAPKGLRVVSRTGKGIGFEWDVADDSDGVVSFALYKDGTILKTDITETHYTDTAVAADTIYKYELTAVDEAGNESEKSESVSAMAAFPKITRVSPSDYQRIGTDKEELTVYFKNYGGNSKNTVDIEYKNSSGEWTLLNKTPLNQIHYSSTEFYASYELNISDIKGNINSDSVSVRYTVTDKDGAKDEYETEYELDNSAPDSPQDVKAEDDNGVVILSWTPSPESDFLQYNIYRFIEGENDSNSYTRVAEIDYQFDNTFEDNTVPEGKKAWYIVTAMDDMGNESSLVDPVSITVGHDGEVPEMVSVLPDQKSISGITELTAEADDNKDISEIRFFITEDSESDNAVMSEIGRSEDIKYLENTDTFRTVVPFDTTEFRDGTYYIYVIAYDSSGNGSVLDFYKRYEIDNTGISRINITDVNAGSTYVQLMWDDVTEEDFSYFLVERKEGDSYVEAVRESKITGCTIDGLTPETVYIFRVCGVDAAGNKGEYSEEVEITTTADTVAPNITAVYPVQGHVRDKLSLSMTVTDNHKVESGIWYLSFDGEKYTEIASSVGNKSSETFEYKLDISDETEFPEGKIYIKSEAFDAAGNKNQLLSDGSDVVMEYTVDRTAPAAVINATARSGDGYISVTWDEGTDTDITAYRIYRADSGSDNFNKVMDDSILDYYDTNIEDGKSYDYYVTAVDEAGNESERSEITSATAKPDETAPKVEGASPADGSKIGNNTEFSIIVTDNSALEKVITYFRSDETGDWILLNESKAAGRSDWIKFTYDFSNEEEGTLFFKTVCEDKNKNISSEKLYSCLLDKTAPSAEIEAVSGNFENYIDITKNPLDIDISYYEIYRSELSESGSDMAFYVSSKSIQKVPAGSGDLIENSTDSGNAGISDNNTVRYTDKDAEPHTAYRYAAKVYDSVGNYTWTEIKNAVATSIDNIAPEISVPEKITATTGMEICFDAENSSDNVRIKSFKWDMGNGETRTGARPRYTYTQSGKYTVKVICTDAAGNSSEREIEVQVKDAEGCGICELTVTDYNGNPIPYAYVYIKAGSDSDSALMTDSYGKISLCYKAGTYKVAAFKDGYLPEEREYKIVNQKTTQAILKLSSGEVVVGSFDVHRMSLQEIVDAGVDLSNPANINTFTFKTTLTFEKSPIPIIIDELPGVVSTGQSYMGGGGFGTPNFTIDWSMDNYVASGGKVNGSVVMVAADEPVPVLAVISVTQSVSWLKTLYSADLTIMNMAGSKYVLEDSKGRIELPKGVSLAVLSDDARNREDTETGQSLIMDMGDIPGQTAKTASWILKGDVSGTYDIYAEYSGMLSPFNVPVTKRFTSQTEMVVDSANVLITVMPEMAYYMDEDYYIQYAITNEGNEPLYNFTTSIGDYRRPPNKDVVYIMDYETGEITDTYSSGAGAIYTIPKTDQLFSTPVLSGSDCITVPTLLPGQTIYGTWKSGEGNSISSGFSGDYRKEYFELINWLVEVIEGENLGVKVKVEPIKSHVSKVIRTSYREEGYDLRVGDPVDTASGGFTESYSALSLSGIDTMDVNIEYDSLLAGYELGDGIRNSGRGWTTNFDSFVKEENGLVMYYTNPYIHSAFISEDVKNGQVNGKLITSDQEADEGEDKEEEEEKEELNNKSDDEDQSENIENNNVTIQLNDFDSDKEDIRFVSLSKDMEGYVLTRHPDGTYEMESPAGQIMKYDTYGQISEYINENGSVTTFSRNGNEIVIEESLSGNKTILTYDSNGHLVKVSDGGERVTNLSYSDDDLVQITDALGRSLYFEYDEEHRITAEKNNSQETCITNEYDDEGRVICQTNSKGQKISFVYEELETGGTKITVTTSNEAYADTVKIVTTDYTGRIISIINETGKEETFAYDEDGNLVSHSDGNGNIDSYTYDEYGNLSGFAGKGGSLVPIYDESGNMTSLSDGKNRFDYTYDEEGNLISSKNGEAEIRYTYDANGCVHSKEMIGKGTERFTWDKGRQSSVTDALGRKTTYEYDAAGNLLKAVSPSGSSMTYEYNAVNQKLSETDANGNKTVYTYDDYNNVKTVTDAIGNTTTFDYNTAGELISKTYADGTKEEYVYDMVGNMTTLIKRDGTEIHYEYDSFGNNTKITYPDNTSEVFEYDQNGNVTKKTDRKSNVYTYMINSKEQKIEGLKDPYGNAVNYALDEYGRTVSMDSSQGVEESYTYDNPGNITSITDKAGNKTVYDYNKWNELESVTDALGNKTLFSYDAAGNCIEKKTPEGLDIFYTYDENNHITKVDTEVQGKQISESYTYDAMGNTLTYTDSMGRVTAYTYDALNRVSSETGPDGIKTEYSYDCFGQLTRAQSSDGTVTNIEYDKSGNITSVTSNSKTDKSDDASGQKYTYSYDEMNRLVSVTDPMGFETSQKYDSLDNITEITDAMGGTTRYFYDETTRLVATEDPLGNRKEFTYDKEGRLLSEKNARGQETTYSYDELNRLIEVKDETGTTEYTYDQTGNQLTITDSSGTITREYDKLGRITDVTDSNGRSVRYTYDEIGNILSLTYPGGDIVRYEYNPDGSLLSVTDDSDNKTFYEYDNAGRLAKTTKPDGSTDENIYDRSGRLIQEIQKKENGEVLLNMEYSYDEQGNIIKIKDNIDFSNDLNYTPEAVRTDEDTSELNMEYDSNNRLIKYNGQEVKYDADGNMIYGPLDGEMADFTYDCRNRLVKAGDTVYTYDADNIRIGVETPDYKEEYVVDRVNSPTQTLQVIKSRKSSTGGSADSTHNSNNAYTTNYYYGRGLIYEISDERDMRVYHFDHNGSTRKITDKTGKLLYSFRYGTYGELLSGCDAEGSQISIEDNSIRFLYNGAVGVITDSNELLYMRQRFYNTEIKRFINQDVLLGDISNSQSLNRYAYVQGNPLRYNDPFGLNPMEFLKKSLMLTLHDMLSIATIIPGIPGAVAGLVNSYLYLCEGNYGMAGFSALNALGVLGFSKFGGALAGGIGNLCSKSSLFKTILCSAMIGGGTLMTTTALVSFMNDMEKLSKAIDSGADASTIFHLISMSICDGAGVYYGVKTIAGGAMGLTSQCFVAGTTVKTKDGDKPIEEVEAGDMVWSFNPETGEEGLKEVKETFVNETEEIEHIELISDSEKQESEISKDQSLKQANHESIIINCTPGHPFYVVDYGFKYASELKLGDRVLSQNGSIYIVQKNQKEQLEEPVKVYNFEVEDWHTYCVSEYGVIVHNLCDGETVDSGSGTDSSGTNVGKGGSDVPNPYGKKGGPAHQKVIESITPKEKGNFIRNEVKFDTTGGTKAYRYADAVEYNKNGEVVAIYQVGKVNKNGTVISRESKAIEDIMNSDDYNGTPIYFLPYNSDIGEIIFDY